MNYDEWKLASPPESTEVTDCCRSGEYYEEYSEVEDCDVTICEAVSYTHLTLPTNREV